MIVFSLFQSTEDKTHRVKVSSAFCKLPFIFLQAIRDYPRSLKDEFDNILSE